MIKLVAIDLDGTLLDSQSNISQKNRKSIRRCLDKGIKVALVTGQNLHYARKIIDSLTLANPHVLANGALVVNQKLEKLYWHLIDPESYKNIVELCRKNNFSLEYAHWTGN